jgi:haloacetate dehalogenase
MFEGFRRVDVPTKGATIHLRYGGAGRPLLLLHGYPQTHAMWHRVAPRLAARFTVVCADLRGYGDSAKPPSDPEHLVYSKRATAQDLVEVMAALGFERFGLAGHDRGGRVAHRLALDHPGRVERVAFLDIVPTRAMFERVDKAFAMRTYHWFFLIQPFDLPERLIGAEPEYFLRTTLERWAAPGARFDPEAVAEYVRCFRNPATIHAGCEDYRAAASIDLVHDEADLDRKLECPVLALWGGRSKFPEVFDVLAEWRKRAVDVRGRALDSGHFVPEEAPEATAAELEAFFGA